MEVFLSVFVLRDIFSIAAGGEYQSLHSNDDEYLFN